MKEANIDYQAIDWHELLFVPYVQYFQLQL